MNHIVQLISDICNNRHAARVKNLWGQVVLCGDNVSPLVEIGLTDPPKSGGAAAPSWHMPDFALYFASSKSTLTDLVEDSNTTYLIGFLTTYVPLLIWTPYDLVFYAMVLDPSTYRILWSNSRIQVKKIQIWPFWHCFYFPSSQWIISKYQMI